MNDKKQAILKKIREANPELMKVQFGCKVLFGSKKRKITRVLCIDEKGELGFLLDRYDNTVFTLKEVEILGKDPTPLDLLRVLRNKGLKYYIKYDTGDRFEFIDMTGFGTKSFKNKYFSIDTSKSIIQNLEDPAFVECVWDIICKE